MAETTHIIQRQVLDITLDTDRDAYLVQEDVRRVYYERIVPMLDEVFSSLVGPDEIVRLDRLELDLGRIARRDLEEEMVTQVRTQLEEILIPRLRAVAPAGDLAAEEAAVHRTTTARSRQAVFVAFVQTGRVPWWVADPAVYDPDAELAALLDETPESLIAALRSLAEPSVSLRLAHQMAPATLARLIRLAAPAAAEAILGVGRRMQVLHDARPLSPLSSDALRVILWSSALAFVLTPAAPAPLVAYVERVAGRLADRGFARATLRARLVVAEEPRGAEDAVLMTWAEAEDRKSEERTGAGSKAPSSPEEASQAQRKPPRDPSAKEPGRTDAAPPTEEAAAPDIPQKRDRADAQPPTAEGEPPEQQEADGAEAAPDAPETTTPEAVADPASSETPLASEASEPPVETASPGLEPAATAVPEDASVKSPGDPAPYYTEVPEEGEAQYITNAGLIVLWPFLGRFFKNLHLVEDQAFVSDEARPRAVLITQYLVTGETEVSEHLLVLNKLLCGWLPEDAIPRSLDLSQTEEDESRVLLETAITHWAVLKKTTTDGFRQAFLQREGKLVRQAQQWTLTIERKGYDVLLDRLPWSISIVKLAWMPEPIFVEW